MVKGCKKNVIHLKNTGSEIFEEAYFIISDKAGTKGKNESDIVKEASKIASGGALGSYFSAPSGQKAEKKKAPSKITWFMLGACVMTAFNAVILMII